MSELDDKIDYLTPEQLEKGQAFLHWMCVEEHEGRADFAAMLTMTSAIYRGLIDAMLHKLPADDDQRRVLPVQIMFSQWLGLYNAVEEIGGKRDPVIGETLGNPFRVGLIACGCRSVGECSCNTFNRETAAEAVQAYRDLPGSPQRIEAIQRELRGKDLACWCPLDQPCHADVLLELANQTLVERVP